MSTSSQQRIMLIGKQDQVTIAIRQHLQRSGYDVTLVITTEAAYYQIAVEMPALVIISAALSRKDAASLCGLLRRNPATQTLPILVLLPKGEAADATIGADAYLSLPFQPPELLARVKSLLASEQLEQSGAQPLIRRRGQTIAVYGVKGGVGKSTIASNLAFAIHQTTGRNVLIFDADFFLGEIGVHLNIPKGHTILNLIKYIDELEPDLANQVVQQHPGGVGVLLNPANPEEAELIAVDHVERLLPFFAGLYPYVIVDCPSGYDERTLTILEHADDILLVITPEIGPIKNTSKFLNLVKRLGLSGENIHLALNRSNSDVGIDVKEIERALDHRVSFQIVSGGRAVVTSTNRGMPLFLDQPNHPFSQHILRMAQQLIALPPRGKEATQRITGSGVQRPAPPPPWPSPPNTPSATPVAPTLGNMRRLGEYLVEQGHLTMAQLRATLDLQAQLRRNGEQVALGQLLLRNRQVTREAIEAALEQQQQDFFNAQAG